MSKISQETEQTCKNQEEETTEISQIKKEVEMLKNSLKFINQKYELQLKKEKEKIAKLEEENAALRQTIENNKKEYETKIQQLMENNTILKQEISDMAKEEKDKRTKLNKLILQLAEQTKAFYKENQRTVIAYEKLLEESKQKKPTTPMKTAGQNVNYEKVFDDLFYFTLNFMDNKKFQNKAYHTFKSKRSVIRSAIKKYGQLKTFAHEIKKRIQNPMSSWYIVTDLKQLLEVEYSDLLEE